MFQATLVHHHSRESETNKAFGAEPPDNYGPCMPSSTVRRGSFLDLVGAFNLDPYHSDRMERHQSIAYAGANDIPDSQLVEVHLGRSFVVKASVRLVVVVLSESV